MKHCQVCGVEYSKHGPSKYCTRCANEVKALQSERKVDRRLKVTGFASVIRLRSGIEVLNNVFGKTMATADKVWNSERAV